jgi:GT2 family glycosyltransferase
MLHCNAITGAAMMMQRDFAAALGGFDEGYVVGDFEDTDLCFKVAAAGRTLAIDTSVRLFHLERKSQAGSDQRWRQNMTLYNAWRHQRRWQAGLAALAAQHV